jgi:hypothetical protein
MKSGKRAIKIDIGFGMVIALVMALGATVILNATGAQGDRAYDDSASPVGVAASVESMRGYAVPQSESRLEPGKSDTVNAATYQGGSEIQAATYARLAQLK